MKIAILGLGKMGAWLAKELGKEHRLAGFDRNLPATQLGDLIQHLTSLDELKAFNPDLLLNCASLQHTIAAFSDAMPYVSDACVLADVASVKGELPAFYTSSGRKFVSVHPMFGPTFASLEHLREQNAVVIRESDDEASKLFVELFSRLGVTQFEYSFDEHDAMMAYSLTLPFVSSMVFASCVNLSAVPGTTFRRHLDVARGLLGEDDYLLSEILFNPNSLAQLEKISSRLNYLWHIIKQRDSGEATRFFGGLRNNLAAS